MNHPISDSELVQARQKLKTDPKALVELRPLPSVAMQISQECRREDVDTKALARLVEGDAAFALKILSVVNSSLYGFSREISTIDQALVVLGRKAVAQLALSIAAQQVYTAGDTAADAKLALFKHSLGCASVARAIITHKSLDIELGAAFLAGILHDIGKIVLLDVAPNNYSTFMNNPNPAIDTVVAEREMFEIDHESIGALFGESWGLTQTISHAIGNHHSTDTDQLPPLTQVISLANQLAKHWGIGQEAIPTQFEPALNWIAENEELLPSITQDATEHFYETKALLLG